jgi:ABC-type antimicrobial peptide transport system permease subunit
MALGAKASQVCVLVAGEGMSLVLIGAALGCFGALAVCRFLHGMLYEIADLDPMTFVISVVMLTLVACFACYFPARRATKINLWAVLRVE